MCPHGYHHSGSMATPALGTRVMHFFTKLFQRGFVIKTVVQIELCKV